MHLLCICLRPLPSNVNVPREFNTVTSQRDSAVATPMKIRLERCSCLSSGIGLSRLQFVEPHLVLVLSSLTVCFLLIKFYWNASSLIYLNTVYGCFYTITAGLSGCDRNHMIYKGKKELLSGLLQKRYDDPWSRVTV